MSRTVEEWIGKSDDTQPPPRVRVRVFDRAKGRCEACTIWIGAGFEWDTDHRVALINGGENRESNLQCLCSHCHSAKTRRDVAEKSKTYAVRAKHLGIKKKAKGRPLPGTKASGFKKRMDGTVERRRTALTSAIRQ